MSGEVQVIAGAVDGAKFSVVEPDGVRSVGSSSTDAEGMAHDVDASRAADWGLGRAAPARIPRRIDPDDGRFIRVVVAGVMVAGVVAFAISFTALYEVAGWLGLPPFMWWAVPVFIDLAILVYAASVLVHKARGERTLASWAALGTFTALSVFANAAHAWSYTRDHDQAWQGVVGAVIAGMVPVAIFVATEQLSRVAVEDPESRRAELREQSRMEHARAEHERQLAHLRFEREKQERQMAQERVLAKRTAELDRERHRAEVAKLQTGHDSEGGLTVKAATETHSPDAAQQQKPEDVPTQDTPTDVQPTGNGSHVVQTRHTEAPVSKAVARDALDEVAEFVTSQIAGGVQVSAAMVAERFGISERTGRRRLSLLRQKRPEVFSEPVSGGWRERA